MARLSLMALGSDMPRLSGYPFEVRYSEGAGARAEASAEVASDAYAYFSGLFSQFAPDISLVVAAERDWPDGAPSFGMPFFSDERGERPGVLVMPAGSGDFWSCMAREIGDSPPRGYANLLAAYPDGAGGLDLQPFIDLLTLHELGHSFEVLGGMRVPTFWLGEIFANVALHTFVASRRPASMATLEAFSLVGAGSEALSARMRDEGYSTLDEFETHYPSSEEPMGWLNYVWFQCRWQRLAAEMFDEEGERALVRCWECFHRTDRADVQPATAASLAPLLSLEVSETLGRAVREWR
ncbi:MAG: hypothetical protein WCF63_08560 [Acidimicrobiales bacterium]